MAVKTVKIEGSIKQIPKMKPIGQKKKTTNKDKKKK